jgi:hypothetical protein
MRGESRRRGCEEKNVTSTSNKQVTLHGK